MFKTNSISLAASLALAGSLTFVGCGSDSADTTSTSTNTTPEVTTESSQQLQTGSISGTVSFINNPTDRTIRNNATTEIVAYNLNDNTSYTTTSTTQGEYDLNGLTPGDYQIVATSTATTMRAIRQTTVERDTRAVLNISLTATGTIKGTVTNMDLYQSIVHIPGTSYISTVDSEGNFEIINVPAGDVTISFNGYHMQNVTVAGGEESIVTFGETIDDTKFNVDSLATDSTLEMHHEGLRIWSNYNSYRLSEFQELVSLVDSNGTAVDAVVEYSYDWYGDDQYANNFVVKTASVADAGIYTLTIGTDEPYTQEITLQDKVAVFSDSYTKSSGVYHKFIGLAFSNPVDLNTSDVTLSYVDDTNNTQVLTVSALEKSEWNENEYLIAADFEHNVEYTVTLDSSVQEDELFYVSDKGWYADSISLRETRVGYISVDDNEEGVKLDSELRFEIYDSEALDLKTLQVTLGDQNLTLANGGLRSYNNYSYYYNHLDIVVDKSSIGYSQDVTMHITANDSYGVKALERVVNFTTITPATVGVVPYVNTNDNDDEWLYDLLNHSYYNDQAGLKAYFNVPVDSTSGAITLYDNTRGESVELYGDSISSTPVIYSNDTNTPYSVRAYPTSIRPNTEYTMTVAGYTTEDGTKIAEKTNTFTTPSRRVISNSVSNGTLRDASQFNNRVEFTLFGRLSDEEKVSFENGLDITSFDTAMPEDKFHPKPLILWDDLSYGSKLILAFTIESGTSYELSFSGDVAKELEMSASPLTFMTMKEMESTTIDGAPEFNIVSNFYTNSPYQDSNLSNVSETLSGHASVTIPYIVDEYHNWDSEMKCENLRYKNIYNYSGDENTPDVNASAISEWISDDANVTSTYLSDMYYNSHYGYDENGNYLGRYYSCDVRYSAKFNIPNEVNSTVSINVPQSALEQGDLV
ncbi:MAG: carboxypeptidase regulatory-like domain-containing protein, partial [Campylobacterota bacterium]|nr:carboxypeptidase regulatory-like domain-containing protein [Campylobacterota bacterium]